MARSQQKSLRKPSGGRYHYSRGKRNYELAGFATNTKLGAAVKARTLRILGGHKKQSILTTNKINVADKKGKAVIADILNVVENPANPHLVRRNIITKGCIVETKLGKAKVTSRPGQEGSVNGVLI